MASPVGDSYQCASGGVITAGRSLWRDARVIVAGDSLTDNTGDWGGGAYQWALALARSPLLVDDNAGFAGTTISSLNIAWNASVASKNPDIVMVRIGTNNVGPTSPIPDGDFEYSYGNLVAAIVSAGCQGVFLPLPPHGNSTKAILDNRNGWIESQAATLPSKLSYIEDSAGIGDAGYMPLPSCYEPEATLLHMNGLGRRIQAEALAPALAARFGTADIRYKSSEHFGINAASSQYVTNPTMAGAGGSLSGGASGSAPAGWSVFGTGSVSMNVSTVVADTLDPCQVPWLRIAPLTGTAGASVNVTSALAHPAFSDQLADLMRLDSVAEIRFNNFEAGKFDMLRFGTETIAGSVLPSGVLKLHLSYTRTLNESIIARQALRRGGRGASALASITANALQVFVKLNVISSFGTSPGSFDIRCVSVQGRLQ